jgi:hypothetical protein
VWTGERIKPSDWALSLVAQRMENLNFRLVAKDTGSWWISARMEQEKSYSRNGATPYPQRKKKE